jgi:hypothetical protein
MRVGGWAEPTYKPPLAEFASVNPRRSAKCKEHRVATGVGTIVETKGRADFWAVASRHNVQADTTEIPTYALIICDLASATPEDSIRLAKDLSRELSAMSMGFVVQTTSDVHQSQVFEEGKTVRSLEYSRDDGGWITVEGISQPWEQAYFFDDVSTQDLKEDEFIVSHKQ